MCQCAPCNRGQHPTLPTHRVPSGGRPRADCRRGSGPLGDSPEHGPAVWVRSEALPLHTGETKEGSECAGQPVGDGNGASRDRPCLEASPGLACGPSVSIVHPFASTPNGPTY